jgi:hypothetical protein
MGYWRPWSVRPECARPASTISKEALSMQIPGYVGICAHCFEPITEEELYQFRPGGRNFHKRCAATENTYYIRREKRIAAKEASHVHDHQS